MSQFRFAAVISHPIQHYSPVFRDLAKVPGILVKVLYSSDWGVKPTYDPQFGQTFAWDVPLLDGYDYEFLPRERPPKDQGFWAIDNPQVSESLATFQPHAIWIHGYGHRVCWRALKWAKGRAATIYFGDSELLHHRAWWRRALKRPIVISIFRRCDAIITIGDNNEAYYRAYGVPDEKIFRAACPVDVQRFLRALEQPGRPTREETRLRFAIPAEAIVVTFSAKLIEKKRPQDLIRAIAMLRDSCPDVHALLIGDGPKRKELEKLTAELSLQRRVHFAGFVNQREMPLLLEAGDIIAMTSDIDPHPLSVTEAMIVGQAIVATDKIGCVGPTDSARPGVNTLVFRVGDVAALAKSIQSLVTDRHLLQDFQTESRKLAFTQDVSVTVRAVLRAITSLRKGFRRHFANNGAKWVSSPILVISYPVWRQLTVKDLLWMMTIFAA